MAARMLLAVAACMALSGCFSELLPAPITTGIGYVCSVLDEDLAHTVVVQSWVADGVDVPRAEAVAALRAELSAITGRDADHVRAVEHEAPDTPRQGWNDTTVRDWSLEAPFLGHGLVAMRILWLPSWGLEGALESGSAPGAGTLVIAQDAVRAGALAMNRSEADVARALVLHHAGHALGVVNQGIAVQDPSIQEREGPPGHDPDPASVLHVAWEDAATMAWAANATYAAYPAHLHADWAAATQPGGICT